MVKEEERRLKEQLRERQRLEREAAWEDWFERRLEEREREPIEVIEEIIEEPEYFYVNYESLGNRLDYYPGEILANALEPYFVSQGIYPEQAEGRVFGRGKTGPLDLGATLADNFINPGDIILVTAQGQRYY